MPVHTDEQGAGNNLFWNPSIPLQPVAACCPGTFPLLRRYPEGYRSFGEAIDVLWDFKSIRGYSVMATDGTGGTVEDFIVEDVGWTIGWLAVETGDWLSGHRVFVPVSAFGKPDPKGRNFPLAMTLAQIGQCESGDPAQLRNNEPDAPFPQGDAAAGAAHQGRDHVRSLARLVGSAIQGTDDGVGHAETFIIESGVWLVKYLIVHTSDWWPGEKVLVPAGRITGFDDPHRILKLDLTRQLVKSSPPFSPDLTEDGAYDESFLTYWGIRFVRK